MLNKAINYLKVQSPAKILFLATAGLLFVGCMDFWVAGQDVRVGIFCLIPVVLAVYFAGPRLGMAMAFLAATMWLVLDLMGRKHYSHLYYAYVNACVRLVFYMVTVYAVTAWKQIGRRLELLVEK